MPEISFRAILLLTLITQRCVALSEKAEEKIKLDLWSRGEFDMSNMPAVFSRMGPVSKIRQQTLQHRDSPHCDLNGFCQLRGGAEVDFEANVAAKIKALGEKFGPDFLAAIEQNEREHKEDCIRSCEMYFCAEPDAPLPPIPEVLGKSTVKSYSMGPVPPEDFADSFG